MTTSSPPKSFDVFLNRRQLTLNRFEDNYSKLVTQLVESNLKQCSFE